MAGGWDFAGPPVRLGGGIVTLVEGSSFCLSDRAGDIAPDQPQGLFFRDTRILSGWQLRLDDERIEPLTALSEDAYRATFLGRARPRRGQVEGTLLVERRRFVGAGMREDIVLHNYNREPVGCTLSLLAEADFADLFEVKEGRVRAANTLNFHVVVPARGVWRTRVLLCPVVDGVEISPSFALERPLDQSGPAVRARQWRESGPRIMTGDDEVNAMLVRSRLDLGALRIFDPHRPDTPMLAAGAPWFMALFGRDSIIASLLALPAGPALALGTAQALARHQGRKADPRTEEEPGRIPHELRLGPAASLVLGGNVYYGSIDATPLFVILLAELRRWGLDRAEVEALLPHADRALQWVERHGDRDGDGFVEYQRATDRGLANQGWKDSIDGITHADGRMAEPPIALAEVQGYVHAAYLARALLAEDASDLDGVRHWRGRAARLKTAFNDRFWLPDRGWYALGLDGAKQPIDALASNMGHCLWTGIVDAERAPRVADLLLAPEMWSGWGIRTLATTMGAYNPMSYHNGSVWPHDNAIAAAGLMRYRITGHAQRVACGVLDAAAEFGGQLPELMCGFDRAEYPVPVPYPTSCTPQAWASATPLSLIWVLLGAQLCVPHRRLRLAPAIPPRLGRVCLDGLPVGEARVRIEVRHGRPHVDGLPDNIELTTEPCPCYAVT